MKNTTVILVILMLVGATVAERKSHRERASRASVEVTYEKPRRIPDTPHTRALRNEMQDLERRLASTDSVIKTVSKSENGIESLIRQAERDRHHALRDIDDDRTVKEIYDKNLRELEQQLAGLRTEKARLQAHRDTLKARRIGLQTELELARLSDKLASSEEKLSPVELIGQEADRCPDHRAHVSRRGVMH